MDTRLERKRRSLGVIVAAGVIDMASTRSVSMRQP